MKLPPSPHDFEEEFADVIESLKIPELRLRSERRALVLEAFEHASARAQHRATGVSWTYAASMAAAIIAVVSLGYIAFTPKPHRSAKANVATTFPEASHPSAENTALCELNVTLAIANARAAAAERELAWLTAIRADSALEDDPLSPHFFESSNKP